MTPRPPQGPPPPRPEPAEIVKPDKVQRVQFAVRSQMLVAKQLESPLLLIGCDSAVDNTSLSKVKLYNTVGRRSIVRAARATRNNQPTNEMIRQGLCIPKSGQKCILVDRNGLFWAKHPNFFKREQKILYHILHTSEYHLVFSFALFFGQAWHQRGQKGKYLAKNTNFWVKCGCFYQIGKYLAHNDQRCKFWAKNPHLWGRSKTWQKQTLAPTLPKIGPRWHILANPMFCIGNPMLSIEALIEPPPVREILLPNVSTPAKLFTFFHP